MSIEQQIGKYTKNILKPYKMTRNCAETALMNEHKKGGKSMEWLLEKL